MEIMDVVCTVNAIGAIGMILIGSAWLKCWLRGMLSRSCSCRWEQGE